MGIPRSGSVGAVIALIGAALIMTMTMASGWIATGDGQSGDIQGRVTAASVGPLSLLTVTTNPEICGQTVPDDSLLVDESGGLANAVVTLVGVPAAEPISVPVVSNDGCRFQPRVQLGQPGGEVRITSADNVLHTTHAYAADGRSLFNVAIPLPGMTITRQLTARGVIRFVCDTHTWMRGFVVAMTDRSAVTAADGTFAFDGVPPRDVRAPGLARTPGSCAADRHGLGWHDRIRDVCDNQRSLVYFSVKK